MKKYLQYDVAEFALDDGFINWVKSPNEETSRQWQSFLDQYPEKQESVNTAKALVERISFEDENIPAGRQDEVWNSIKAKTENSDNVRPKPGKVRWLFPAISVAAAVAILVFFFLPITNQITLHRTDFAEQMTQQLPDNSVVHINSQSQISYDDEAWAAGERTLHLVGEAFFEVEKGSKFTVLTKNGDVSVLGTSFNVFSRKNILNVECKTGKVSVVDRDKQTTILTPDEAVIAIGGKAQKRAIVSSRSDWRSRSYHYDDQPLSEVIEDLERSFDVDVVLTDDLRLQKFTGNIKMNNLDSALYQITWPMRLASTKTGNQITISEGQ